MHRPRLRLAAGIAAVALIGLSVFGIVESAYAVQPSPPSIDQPASPVSTGTDSLATITGTWVNDAASSLIVSDSLGTVCTTTALLGDGTWSCVPDANTLEYGANSLTATTSNGSETSVPSGAVSVVRISPAPGIDAPGQSGQTFNSFSLSGTVPNPNSQTITIGVDDTYNGVTEANWCQPQAHNVPTWFCADTLVGFGVHTFTAHAWVDGSADDKGAISNTVTETLGGMQGTTIAAIPESTNKRPTITGTGPSMGSEQVQVDGVDVCASAPVDASGNWSCTPASDFTDGAHTISTTPKFVDNTADSPPMPVDFTVDAGKPSVSYSFGPASIAVSVTSDDSGYNANTQLYNITSDNEGGYTFGPPVAGCPSSDPNDYSSPSVSCSFGSLSPGVWNVYSGQRQLETNVLSARENDFIRIPETPSISALLNPDHTLRLSGHGTAGDLVTVSNAANATVCTSTVAASGTWACTVSPAEGTYNYKAIALSQGFVASANNTTIDRSYQGYSAYTAAIRVVVPAPTVPITYAIDFTTSVDSVTPGDTVTFTGTGPPGATVTGELHSTPIDLGSTVVGPDGNFTLTALIPMDVPPGAHHFVITVTAPGGTPVVVEKPVTVYPAADAGKSTPGNPDHAGLLDTGHRGAASAVDRNAPGAPSVLTTALPTIQTLIKNPIVIGVAAAGGLALLLFVAFPAELLNSTLSENYDRMFGRVRKIRLPWLARVSAWFNRVPVTGGLLVTAIAALIFGFADPHFGFDLTSLRLVLACAVALFIIGYCANALAALIVRKRWAVTTSMDLKPIGLVLTIVGVLVSRLLDFSPGILIGLIIGMSLTGTTTVKQKSRAILIKSGIMLGISLLAWLLLSALQSGGEPESFLPALANDTLAGIVTEGLTALVVGLLPFRFLDGEHVFAQSWKLWAGTYLVALVAFCLIVLPSDEHWKAFGSSFVVWISVVVGFAIVTLGLYLFLRTRYRAAKVKEQEESAEQVRV